MNTFKDDLKDLLTQVGLEFKAEEIKRNNISYAILNIRQIIKNSTNQIQETNNSSANLALFSG